MKRFLSLLVLLVPACASAAGTFEPLAANHPANPRAAEAPIEDPAPFLRGETKPPPAAAPAAPDGAPAPPASTAAYVCPMHPEVGAAEPGTCPKCGMQLVPRAKEHAHGG